MYTNINNHGGNFRNILDSEFSSAQDVTIATGYASLDIINAYANSFIKIANSGGNSRLLLGMAFYEGLGQKKLDALSSLNQKLLVFGNSSGVYVSNGRRYHGKVYHFKKNKLSNYYIGSSNFSSSGTKGNIECTIPILHKEQKKSLGIFLKDLYSTKYSITIDKAAISVPGKKKIIQKRIANYWGALKRHSLKSTIIAKLPKFEFSLSRIADKEKSSLNVYFGKGRLNSKTGIITPRPWYEIELIAEKNVRSQPEYPQGDFLAFTDDGFVIPMRTQGDYFKNIRSKDSLQIFGIWLKGKLEKSGVLKKYEPVTLDTLIEYGNDKLSFYKINDQKYYMKF